MSILIRAYTVVMRRDALEAHYPELAQRGDLLHEFGWAGTYRADDHLAAVSFMAGSYVDDFVDHLTARGLRVFKDDGSYADLALLDAADGLLGPCDWLEVIWQPGHPNSPIDLAPHADPAREARARRRARDAPPIVHLAGTRPGRLALMASMEKDREKIESQLVIG